MDCPSLCQVETETQKFELRALITEYLEWTIQALHREYGLSFDAPSLVESDMRNLAKFSPPSGRLLIATCEGRAAGTGSLRMITENQAEVKRMYVRPEFRGRGIGRAILARLLDEARQIGYTVVRLDSARFMHAAHGLYQSAGFRVIEPYAESEIPLEVRTYWVFMEANL